MLNEKLKNLEDTKVYMINSIASLLSASTGKSSKVFFDEGTIKIVSGETKAVEVIDNLVYPHSGRLPIKTTEPIAQGSMEHCLDVYYWERVHGYSNKGYELLPMGYEQEE
ncbi:hypothetical protein X577_gp005 [Staphylococcus phage S25-4]|uniref:Uncharacterized protein n=1 Tax=Staphylococcus phage S25-4 TaxID=1041527 RepID=V5XWQ0_BPS24|nr:hypothetical protein X577_gp005 [Staphylococcus phage S25-4]BAO09548.1 hypothetical protein [Staphylococcus phage S25-4]